MERELERRFFYCDDPFWAWVLLFFVGLLLCCPVKLLSPFDQIKREIQIKYWISYPT